MAKKYYIIGGILALLLIIVGAFLATGGNKPKPKDQKVEITWWKTFEDTENVSNLINDFQTANKNVVVKFVKKDAATYEKDLVNAQASNSGPDVFSIHISSLPIILHQFKP